MSGIKAPPSPQAMQKARELVHLDEADSKRIHVIGKPFVYQTMVDAKAGCEELQLLLATALDEYAVEHQVRNSWLPTQTVGQG